MIIFKTQLIIYIFCVLLGLTCRAEMDVYDPLSVTTTNEYKQLDLTVTDSLRKRDIPIRIYMQEITNTAPVILFSHGLGGSRSGNAYLGKHWAARGYAAVFLQHPGSDASVWKETPPAQRMEAMHNAANLQNFLLRVKDVPAVLDQLDRWNRDRNHVLYSRLNLSKTGMSGHSFGAVTTQAVSGQNTPLGKSLFTDKRIDAAVVMSPSTPRRGKAETLFKDVSIPWLLMTGTKDLSIIGNTDMKSRLAVYPALPPVGKYELVLNNAEHSAFNEHALPGDTQQRNSNHHRVILAISTAFWDTYLRNDDGAKSWLDGEGTKSILQKEDIWKKK